MIEWLWYMIEYDYNLLYWFKQLIGYFYDTEAYNNIINVIHASLPFLLIMWSRKILIIAKTVLYRILLKGKTFHQIKWFDNILI